MTKVYYVKDLKTDYIIAQFRTYNKADEYVREIYRKKILGRVLNGAYISTLN